MCVQGTGCGTIVTDFHAPAPIDAPKRLVTRGLVLPQSTVGVQSLTHLHATVWADI